MHLVIFGIPAGIWAPNLGAESGGDSRLNTSMPGDKQVPSARDQQTSISSAERS
jgi:hypothetical protein